jgi:hypothetical protein
MRAPGSPGPAPILPISAPWRARVLAAARTEFSRDRSAAIRRTPPCSRCARCSTPLKPACSSRRRAEETGVNEDGGGDRSSSKGAGARRPADGAASTGGDPGAVSGPLCATERKRSPGAQGRAPERPGVGLSLSSPRRGKWSASCSRREARRPGLLPAAVQGRAALVQARTPLPAAASRSCSTRRQADGPPRAATAPACACVEPDPAPLPAGPSPPRATRATSAAPPPCPPTGLPAAHTTRADARRAANLTVVAVAIAVAVAVVGVVEAG